MKRKLVSLCWYSSIREINSYLALNKVSNTSLGHDGDGHCVHDILDHVRVRHARHATLDSDIGRNPFEGHDSGSTSLFGNTGLNDS